MEKFHYKTNVFLLSKPKDAFQLILLCGFVCLALKFGFQINIISPAIDTQRAKAAFFMQPLLYYIDFFYYTTGSAGSSVITGGSVTTGSTGGSVTTAGGAV